MSFPLFRFTLSHNIAGSLVISEPDAWEEASMQLARSDDAGIIENFDQPVIFFSGDGVTDGGLSFIQNILSTYGPDADVNILIEISDDGDPYETLFWGLLDLSEAIEIDGYKIECPILRSDMWTRFQNQRETAIDLQSGLDLYGGARSIMPTVTLSLPPQKIRVNYSGLHYSTIYVPFTATAVFGNVDFAINVLNEIKEKFEIPTGLTTGNDVVAAVRPEPLFAMKYDGVYTFTADLRASNSVPVTSVVTNIECYIQINDDAIIAFSKADISPGGANQTQFTYSASHTLSKGDYVRIYWFNTSVLANPFYWIQEGTLTIVGDTTYTASTTPAMMVHEVAQSILDRIVGFDDSLQSTILGNTNTQPANYTADGCASWFANVKGLQIRQWSLYDKPFAMSFNDFWEGMNPIFNLGIGYLQTSHEYEINQSIVGASSATEYTTMLQGLHPPGAYQINAGLRNVDQGPGGTVSVTLFVRNSDGGQATLATDSNPTVAVLVINGSVYVPIAFDELGARGNKIGGSGTWDFQAQVTLSGTKELIEIEQKRHFYDSSAVSIYLNYVNKVERSTKTDVIFKNIKIGYQKWESEESTGIDDPQTKHEYAVSLKKTGSQITLYSKFVAASLAIENARRASVDKFKDYQADQDVFIIAIRPAAETSPQSYTPELDEKYSSVTGLINSTTRYNQRLTVGRNFLRWREFFNSGLSKYTALDYQFVNGEGNLAMSSDFSTAEVCDTQEMGAFVENQDIDITASRLFTDEVWEFFHPLTWSEYKQIRDNKYKVLAIARGGYDYQGFVIDKIDWIISQSLGKFTLIKSELPSVEVLNIIASLSTSVGGATWSAFFDSGSESKQFDTIGNGQTFTSTLTWGDLGGVICNAGKNTNGGIAQANGSVVFSKNGITVQTTTFLTSDDVALIIYIFTGVVDGDTLRATITEG